MQLTKRTFVKTLLVGAFSAGNIGRANALFSNDLTESDENVMRKFNNVDIIVVDTPKSSIRLKPVSRDSNEFITVPFLNMSQKYKDILSMIELSCKRFNFYHTNLETVNLTLLMNQEKKYLNFLISTDQYEIASR